MKINQFTLLLILTSTFPAIANEGYVNWIRQIQFEDVSNDGGDDDDDGGDDDDDGGDDDDDGNSSPQLVKIVTEMSVQSFGQSLSKDGIPRDGAVFELWTREVNPPYTSYKLDTDKVGGFLPEAEITIKTLDPHPTPRTRADQPFSVTINVEGLKSDDDAPAEARMVRFKHLAENYPDGLLEFPDDKMTATPQFDGYLTRNGDEVLRFEQTNIPADDPLAAIGEERFSVETVGSSATALAEARLDVFPVPAGTITGPENGSTVRVIPENFINSVEDAYPGSQVYLQFTMSVPGRAPVTQIIQDTHRNIRTDQPDSFETTLTSLERFISVGGAIYNFELISKSPFGNEILDSLTFTYDPSIKLRGNFQSLTN